MILIPQPIHADAVAVLEEADTVVAGPDWEKALPDATALIVRNSPIAAAHLSAAPGLRAIARVGVGTDTIDLDAATARGIPVVITPEANSVAVAEHTFALILAQQRRISAGDMAVRQGRFAERDSLQGRTLNGRVLGIAGYGRTGASVAKLGAAFGMRILVWTRRANAVPRDIAETVEDLDDLLGAADIVSLHLPLTDETRDLFSADRISRMKKGAVLVNTARAGIVDTNALAHALRTGRLGGAAIDVYDGQPGSDHPLLATQAVMTPHVAAMTEEAFRAMSLDAALATLDLLDNRYPRHVVNGDGLAQKDKEITR